MRHTLARRGVTSTAAALTVLLTTESAQAAPVGLAATISTAAITTATTAAATATAAATSATLTTTLILMSTTKTLTITAAIAALALGGAFYSAHSERVAEKSLAEAKRKNTLLLARSNAAEQRLQTAQAKAEEERQAALEVYSRSEAFMKTYPKVMQSLVTWNKAATASSFYRLRGELAMTDEQWEEFLRISCFAAGVLATSRDGQKRVLELIPPERAENWHEEVRALLGDAGFTRFLEENNRRRSNSGDLAKALWFTDTPLSAGQARQLDELFSSRASESRVSPDSYVMSCDDNAWNEILMRASAFLSEPQMEALNNRRTVAAWQNENREGRYKLRSEMEAQSPGGKTK
jgi:hypothetical protein